MFKYVIHRILQSIPILIVVLTLVFMVVRVLPGDPAVAALGDYASEESVQALFGSTWMWSLHRKPTMSKRYRSRSPIA